MHETTAVDASQYPSTAAPGKRQTVTWHPVSRLDVLLARGLFFWSSLSESLIARDAPGLPCMWQNCCKGIMIRGPHKCWLLPICAQGGSPQSNNTHAKRYESCIFHATEHSIRNKAKNTQTRLIPNNKRRQEWKSEEDKPKAPRSWWDASAET